MKPVLDILGQLNPLFQAATLIALIIYVWKTWSMASATSKAALASEASIREMRLSREEQAKPKVVCYFEHNKTSKRTYDFVIKNCGNSTAFNVRLVFSPQLERYVPGRIQGGLKEKTFKLMAPGYEWRTFWDSFPGSDESLIPDEFIANISYDWDKQQQHEAYEVFFDIKSIRGNMWLSETTIEDSLKEIAKSIKDISNALEIQAKGKQH